MVCLRPPLTRHSKLLYPWKETIRSSTSNLDEKAYAYSLIDAAVRTHKGVAAAGEARLNYVTRFKAINILTGKE
jgi:hypothetical protein